MLWADYDKSRLAPGDAHMIGRDQVERALRSAGATIESLSLGPRVTAQGDAEEMIFDLYWVGDGRSGHLVSPRRHVCSCDGTQSRLACGPI